MVITDTERHCVTPATPAKIKNKLGEGAAPGGTVVLPRNCPVLTRQASLFPELGALSASTVASKPGGLEEGRFVY